MPYFVLPDSVWQNFLSKLYLFVCFQPKSPKTFLDYQGVVLFILSFYLYIRLQDAFSTSWVTLYLLKPISFFFFIFTVYTEKREKMSLSLMSEQFVEKTAFIQYYKMTGNSWGEKVLLCNDACYFNSIDEHK
jgi:hypothetical protein